MQALANGDWFVGWGQEPDFSEFGPDGQLLFDAHFPAHTQSYRALSLRLDGHAGASAGVRLRSRSPGAPPPSTPAGTAPRSSPRWRVLSGPSAASLQPVALVPRSGFETAIALAPGTIGADVEVQALERVGRRARHLRRGAREPISPLDLPASGTNTGFCPNQPR